MESLFLKILFSMPNETRGTFILFPNSFVETKSWIEILFTRSCAPLFYTGAVPVAATQQAPAVVVVAAVVAVQAAFQVCLYPAI
jgi:hypothetical protein